MIPKIIVKKQDRENNAKFITGLLNPEFIASNTSLPFEKRVYGLLPELKDKIKNNMITEEIYQEVYHAISERFIKDADTMDRRVLELQQAFDGFSKPLLLKMLEIFELEWPETQGEILCYIGCYPVFPRDVMKKEFWVNYNTPDAYILGASIHEINHFMAFEKWKAMHGYDKKVEPMHPEPLWFLEEIIVDPTLNEPELQKIASYPQRAYTQFYEESINGIVVMEHIKKIYNERNNMADFLDRSYSFIEEHIEELIVKCG